MIEHSPPALPHRPHPAFHCVASTYIVHSVLWFSTFKSFHSFSRDVSCLATLFLNEIKKNNAFLYSPHLHLRVVLFGLLLDMHDELYDEDRIGTTPFTTCHDRSWYYEMPLKKMWKLETSYTWIQKNIVFVLKLRPMSSRRCLLILLLRSWLFCGLARLAAHPANSFSEKNQRKVRFFWKCFLYKSKKKNKKNVLSFSSVFQNLVFETLSPPFPVRVASDMKETSNDIIRHFCSVRAPKDAFARKGQKPRQGGLQRLHSPMYLWWFCINPNRTNRIKALRMVNELNHVLMCYLVLLKERS